MRFSRDRPFPAPKQDILGSMSDRTLRGFKLPAPARPARPLPPAKLPSGRYEQVPKGQAYFYDVRWDELSVEELDRIGIVGVRVVCTGLRHDVPGNADPWHRRCGRVVEINVARLIGLDASQRFAAIKPHLRCSECGAFSPILLPLRRVGD